MSWKGLVNEFGLTMKSDKCSWIALVKNSSIGRKSKRKIDFETFEKAAHLRIIS